MARRFRNGQHVEYSLPHSPDVVVEAIVRAVHGDGTVTVEARFCRDKQGDRSGGYLGYRYRYSARTLRDA